MKAANKKKLTKAIQAYVDALTPEQEWAAYTVARALGATAEQLEAAKGRKR